MQKNNYHFNGNRAHNFMESTMKKAFEGNKFPFRIIVIVFNVFSLVFPVDYKYSFRFVFFAFYVLVTSFGLVICTDFLRFFF